MAAWVPIRYRDFWDVPRMFLVEHRGRLFLFDCPFNDQTEDYEDSYRIYLMPPLPEATLEGSWEHLPDRAIGNLGRLAVQRVTLDATRRAQMSSTILDELLDHDGFAAFGPDAPITHHR